MKVCIYFEGIDSISKSGVGRAFKHQIRMCQEQKIEYTTDYKDKYDILHINTVFLKSDEAIRYARKQNAKVIYHAHTTKEDFQNSFTLSNVIAPGFKQWLIHLYSKADLILTPTEYSKSLIESYEIEVPVFSISNGIDVERFKPSKRKEKKFKDYFEIKDGEKVIMSVGLWFERKGILDFIELARKFPKYKFIWFGYTPPASIPHKIKLAIEEKPDNCLFPGYIAGDIIEGAYTSVDAFVFMSYEETEGIVVLEALASKQNVLIRDIPVYNDWLKNGYNVLKATSINDFKKQLKYFLDFNDQEIKQNGYQVACQKDIKIVSRDLKNIYQKLID